MVSLSYLNILTADIDRLAIFYATLFGLEEIVESRSPIFRGLRTEGASIGFSAPAAYEMLGLTPFEGNGDRTVLTFDVKERGEVDRLTEVGVAMGAQQARAPFTTYYGWYLSVLRDPDGNAFRISWPGV